MSDKVFIDTNILVYSYSNNELDKRDVARNIIRTNLTIVSTQVIQELINIITKKLGFTFKDASTAISEVLNGNKLFINNNLTIKEACRIAERYKFSFYDSLILSAALESQCSIVYTEDLKNGQVIDGKLTILNPFY